MIRERNRKTSFSEKCWLCHSTVAGKRVRCFLSSKNKAGGSENMYNCYTVYIYIHTFYNVTTALQDILTSQTNILNGD